MTTDTTHYSLVSPAAWFDAIDTLDNLSRRFGDAWGKSDKQLLRDLRLIFTVDASVPRTPSKVGKRPPKAQRLRRDLMDLRKRHQNDLSEDDDMGLSRVASALQILARERATGGPIEEISDADYPPPPGAADILDAAAGHLRDRAETYDSAGGERSMAKCVCMFNALVGDPVMTTEQGWLFMALLKIVRSQQGRPKLDNFEDLAAYAALAGEEALAKKPAPRPS